MNRGKQKLLMQKKKVKEKYSIFLEKLNIQNKYVRVLVTYKRNWTSWEKCLF